MSDFLSLFDTIVKEKKRHIYLRIYCSKVAGWCISVFKKGGRNDGADIQIVAAHSIYMEIAFAKAQVELKEWLSENEGGY